MQTRVKKRALLRPLQDIGRMDLPGDVAFRWLRYEAAVEEEWQALLPPEERLQAVAFRRPRRRQEFMLGRVAARTLLGERLGVAPAEVPLQVAESGAVEVVGDPHRLSIAHAAGEAVAAVARRAVGVDLEQIAPRHPELHRFMLHPDEYGLFERLPLDPVRACILCWTLKEAVLKARCTGFRLSPKKLRLEIDVAGAAAAVHEEEGPSWQARFQERDGFYLAIAYRE